MSVRESVVTVGELRFPVRECGPEVSLEQLWRRGKHRRFRQTKTLERAQKTLEQRDAAELGQSAGTVGQDAAPAIFATRRITPESTVTPVREMVWK